MMTEADIEVNARFNDPGSELGAARDSGAAVSSVALH